MYDVAVEAMPGNRFYARNKDSREGLWQVILIKNEMREAVAGEKTVFRANLSYSDALSVASEQRQLQIKHQFKEGMDKS